MLWFNKPQFFGVRAAASNIGYSRRNYTATMFQKDFPQFFKADGTGLVPPAILKEFIRQAGVRKYWTSDKKCCHKEVTVKSERHHQRLDRIKTVVLGILMFCIGILSEVYINPEIMRKITLLFN